MDEENQEFQETAPETTTEQPVQPELVVQKPELPKKLVEQPKQIGSPTPGKMERLKAFITECKRVLRVTKKPDKQEFTTIVKISSIGMAIIGVIGFLVHLIKEFLF